MPPRERFPAVFAELRQLLSESAGDLIVQTDEPHKFELWAPPGKRFPRPTFFGAVRLGKTYVSYYLMPIYVFPDLLAGLPRALKVRMQGKSCFNFTVVTPDQRLALADLTRRARERYRVEEVG